MKPACVFCLRKRYTQGCLSRLGNVDKELAMRQPQIVSRRMSVQDNMLLRCLSKGRTEKFRGTEVSLCMMVSTAQ